MSDDAVELSSTTRSTRRTSRQEIEQPQRQTSTHFHADIMDGIMEDVQQESQDILQETPVADVFVPPSIYEEQVLLGDSYTHHSPIPKTIKDDMTTECVLGVDEAGRGPVLGE